MSLLLAYILSLSANINEYFPIQSKLMKLIRMKLVDMKRFYHYYVCDDGHGLLVAVSPSFGQCIE